MTWENIGYYAEYLNSHGADLTNAGGGGYTYTPSTPPPPPPPSNPNDPWQRDANGNIILTPTNGETTIDYTSSTSSEFDNVVLKFAEYKIKGPNNEDVYIYKVTGYIEDGITYDSVPEK